MAESSEVAIIQHESDVLQVAHHYFENGITHFTKRINKCISFGCSNGEVAPFVGHNAFLRWSAVQDASFVDPVDGKIKQWSESHVSEDFDMALRLLLKGYVIRWASYAESGFKEGVSLTVVDELTRWEKYAYGMSLYFSIPERYILTLLLGCDELIFNPLWSWFSRGPISKQLRTFVWCPVPVHYKLAMMAYMFSYYGIACCFLLSVLNYILLGLLPSIDRFYLNSFQIFFACIAVFPLLGNVAYTVLEYRLGQKSLWASFVQNFKWIPFFTFFFGGLAIHVSIALLAHLFSYNITWGATAKEVERSTFWLEGA
jgi:cellulose synthase/poly-beta-1,6-N-acetylglucosamine synthase-like glycosyltransferase